MRTSTFVFLGIAEHGSDANIARLKQRIQKVFAESQQSIHIDLLDDLLTLNIHNPDLNIYISFIAKNNKSALLEWKELARNFELPWDMKPVDEPRLENIYLHLQENGWYEYMPFRDLAFTILNEVQKFDNLKVLTIPSMGISLAKDKIFKKAE